MNGMVKGYLKGRLGNCCFIAANTIAYALDRNMPFTLSNTTKDPVMQPLYFQHLVNSNYNEAIPSKWVREMQHNYQPLPWDDCWRNFNVQLMGFWQSFKYFEHRKEEVIKALQLPYYPHTQNVVGIHVRRGDYLEIKGKHILNTDGDYMGNALDYLGRKNYMFEIFTDDHEFCKEYFKQFGISFRGKEGSPLEDLARLSTCRHFINSSSTFSLFASWLGRAEDKICISPKEWFQSSQPENTIDIVPENYIRL